MVWSDFSINYEGLYALIDSLSNGERKDRHYIINIVWTHFVLKDEPHNIEQFHWDSSFTKSNQNFIPSEIDSGSSVFLHQWLVKFSYSTIISLTVFSSFVQHIFGNGVLLKVIPLSCSFPFDTTEVYQVNFTFKFIFSTDWQLKRVQRSYLTFLLLDDIRSKKSTPERSILLTKKPEAGIYVVVVSQTPVESFRLRLNTINSTEQEYKTIQYRKNGLPLL